MISVNNNEPLVLDGERVLNPLRQVSKVILLLVVFLLSGCQGEARFNNSELENVPGAYAYSEGESKYVNLYQRAAQHLGSNEFADAEEVYRELIQLEPENFNGYIGLGSSLFFQDQYEDAREAYQMAFDLNPNSVQAIIGIGSAYSASGQYELAVDAYRTAIDIDPDEVNAHWGLAIVMDKEGYSKDEIIVHLEKIIKIDPKSALAVEARDWIDRLNSEN